MINNFIKIQDTIIKVQDIVWISKCGEFNLIFYMKTSSFPIEFNSEELMLDTFNYLSSNLRENNFVTINDEIINRALISTASIDKNEFNESIYYRLLITWDNNVELLNSNIPESIIFDKDTSLSTVYKSLDELGGL